MIKHVLVTLSGLLPLAGLAQFDPAGGEMGSLAVHRQNEALHDWADSVVIERGLQDASDTSLGEATTGSHTDATGKADGLTVSLGDGGSATYVFEAPIKNHKERPDFAVFENGFSWTNGYFLELGFVEVSADGSRFVRFPCQSAADTSEQIWNLSNMKPEWYYNLAGKHQAPYGTPFDLDELKDSSINLDSIRFIRIVDVVGSLQDSFASYDALGNKVNDPWPTPFESSGFDLDGLGLIDGSISSVMTHISAGAFGPNPLLKNTRLNVNFDFSKLEVISPSGQVVKSYEAQDGLHMDLPPSTYVLRFVTKEGIQMGKLCVY